MFDKLLLSIVRLAIMTGNGLQITVVLATSCLGGFAHGHACILIGIDALAEMYRIFQLLQQHSLEETWGKGLGNISWDDFASELTLQE